MTDLPSGSPADRSATRSRAWSRNGAADHRPDRAGRSCRSSIRSSIAPSRRPSRSSRGRAPPSSSCARRSRSWPSGLNIVMGFAGLLDLGYVAFYAIGAYTTAFLASPPLRHPHQLVDRRLDRRRGRPRSFGILLGAPTLKLRGDYLAIVTLGFGEIVRIVFRNLGDFTLALPAFLGGADPHRPERQPDRRQRRDQPDRPTDHPDPRAVGPDDHLLEPERDRLVLPGPRPAGPDLLHLRAPARLEARARLDGHPRGRDRGRRDGHQHRHDEAPGVLAGRELLGLRRRVHRRLPDGDLRRDASTSDVSILVVVIIILGGIGSLRGVVIGAFAVQYVNQTLLRSSGTAILNDPIQCARRRDRASSCLRGLQPGQLQLPDLRRGPGGHDDQATRRACSRSRPPRPRCTASASPPR